MAVDYTSELETTTERRFQTTGWASGRAYRELFVMNACSVSERLSWLAASVLLAGVWLASHGVVRSDDDADAIRQARGLSRAFRAAAKAVVPTVVEVRTETKVPARGGRNPFRGTPFEEFFEDHPDLRWRLLPDMPSRPAIGLGSGVIINASGIVLTNNHVVEGADEITVVLADGRQFKATDVKTDPKSDLAVVQIQPETPLPAARLGDSDKLEIGDWVLAIGNPFELESTVSAGIVSAKARSLSHLGRAAYIQTDAAINPGNSGGPLVNLDGEIVGINTAIASRSGGYQGIGFAIPSNTAKWVTAELIKRGKVQRSYLGVAIDRVDGQRAKHLGVQPHRGVLVGRVFPQSPAQEAGIREDDVILSIDGREVNSAAELQEFVERLAPGSKHETRLVRAGKPIAIPITVQAMPEEFGLTGTPNDGFEGYIYRSRQLGFSVVDLTESLAKRFGVRPGSGALVLAVDRDGLA